MKPTGLVAVLILAMLAGCSADAVKRSAYEAAYQRQCMESAGQPNCDPEHQSYDDYQREREALARPPSQ